MRPRLARSFLILAAILLAASCTIPGIFSRSGTEKNSILPVASDTPTPTITPTSQAEVNCYYTWAYNGDEEGTAKARRGLDAAGVRYEQAFIQLFGENATCTDGSMRFLEMESTLNIDIPVETLQDNAALGAFARKLLGADFVLSVAKYVNLRFVAGEGSTSLRLWSERGQELLEQDLEGADFWLALVGSLEQTDVSGMAFSPDARWFLTSSSDGFIRIWEVSTGRLSRVIFIGGRGGEIAFTPDREDFFVASGMIKLHHFEDGSLIASFGSPAGEAYRLSLSPDGKTLVTLSQAVDVDNGIVSVYDVSGVSPSLLYMPNGPVKSLAISPDSERLAVNTGSGQVQVMELATGNPLLAMQRQFPAPESICSVDYTSSLSFSPDGKIVALSFCSEYVDLFDAASGSLETVLAPGGLLVGKTAFTPDGRLLAVATHDGTELLSTADWTLTLRLKKLDLCEVCMEDVKTLALSPDGSLLAVAVSGKVEIWRVEDGALVVELG